MTAPDKNLGEKIRTLRTQKGITQKDLAGDKITRNMLSLIEGGNASPSVSTLLYIAERLDTPVGYFFSTSEEDEGRFFKMSIIENLKQNFHSKKYRECTEICADIPKNALDDELSYILAVSYINLSAESAYGMDIRHAYTELEKASVYAEKSIYCTEIFSKALDFYFELYRSLCSDAVPGILCDQAVCSEYVPHDTVRYFIALRSLSASAQTYEAFTKGSFCDRHVSAVLMLLDGQTNEAQKRLRELSLDPDLPYFMHYRVLCDLENAANISGDLKLAYSSSRRRLELIEKFRI